LQSELSGSTFGGSEDFSYVSQKVPSAVISLTAGDSARGFEYPLHHQKARFDESVLPNGAAFLAFCAASFPQDFQQNQC
jgi:hippurate hydrolase